MSLSAMATTPFTTFTRAITIIQIAQSIIRTFMFMRIIKQYSPIVTMLTQVTKDLRQFLLLYMISLFLFSQVLVVLGIANTTLPGDLKTAKEKEDWYPGIEF